MQRGSRGEARREQQISLFRYRHVCVYTDSRLTLAVDPKQLERCDVDARNNRLL